MRISASLVGAGRGNGATADSKNANVSVRVQGARIGPPSNVSEWREFGISAFCHLMGG